MSSTQEEPTIQQLMSRLTELEQAHANLQKELLALQAQHMPAGDEQASRQAGAMQEPSSGTAPAANAPGPGVFASSVVGTSAVKATGTNGAAGVDASSDSGIGVHGQSSSAYGVYGSSDLNDGVHGESNSVNGIFGRCSSGVGVAGVSESGRGIYGTSDSGLAGHFAGNVQIDGNLNVSNNIGIGTTTPQAGLEINMGTANNLALQVSSSGLGWGSGIRLRNTGSEGPSQGKTYGIYSGQEGELHVADVDQSVDRLIIDPVGNIGVGTRTPQEKLHIEGNLFVNGSIIKSGGAGELVRLHTSATSPEEIVYATPIGSEVGTYIRGTGQLDDGKAVIKLPEHFGLVTSEDSLTVQFTPRGDWLQLYVVNVNTEELVVQEAQGKSGQFDYLVQGVRKGYEHHEVIQEPK